MDTGGYPQELDFEVFVAVILFDRNSQVRFHKLMVTALLEKSSVHRGGHALRPKTF